VAGSADELICPSCGAGHQPSERFCARCNLPLTYSAAAAGGEPPSDLHRRARKVKPQLAEGRLVRVTGARNQAEAEFIQSLLLEEGVPSVLRRSAGFDVPDFLAAGPRDIMVPQSGVTTAREVLLQAELIPETPARTTVAPGRLALALLVALVLGALLVWLISLIG
jgi:hypothetical protein